MYREKRRNKRVLRMVVRFGAGCSWLHSTSYIRATISYGMQSQVWNSKSKLPHPWCSLVFVLLPSLHQHTLWRKFIVFVFTFFLWNPGQPGLSMLCSAVLQSGPTLVSWDAILVLLDLCTISLNVDMLLKYDHPWDLKIKCFAMFCNCRWVNASCS